MRILESSANSPRIPRVAIAKLADLVAFYECRTRVWIGTVRLPDDRRCMGALDDAIAKRVRKNTRGAFVVVLLLLLASSGR